MDEETRGGKITGGITWIKGDGLLEPTNYARRITFKEGFVRVRAPNHTPTVEGRADAQERTFDVPANHRCEVLGTAQYYFVDC